MKARRYNLVLYPKIIQISTKPHHTITNLSNDRTMIRQICNVKPEDVATIRSNELFAQLEIDDLDFILREKTLQWFGHVEPSSGAIKTVCDIQIDGKRGPGQPKMSWKTLPERDHRQWNLNEVTLVIRMCGDQV